MSPPTKHATYDTAAAATSKRSSTKKKKKAVIKIDKTIGDDIDHHHEEEQNHEHDPVQSIAFLNDSNRKYKKSSFRRPMTLSELDRKRTSLERAMKKAKAKARGHNHQAQFEYGQRCAERALESIFRDYGMTNENVDSYTMMTKTSLS